MDNSNLQENPDSNSQFFDSQTEENVDEEILEKICKLQEEGESGQGIFWLVFQRCLYNKLKFYRNSKARHKAKWVFLSMFND
jgi:hypothetical protein